jgi:hypothetical protein
MVSPRLTAAATQETNLLLWWRACVEPAGVWGREDPDRRLHPELLGLPEAGHRRSIDGELLDPVDGCAPTLGFVCTWITEVFGRRAERTWAVTGRASN